MKKFIMKKSITLKLFMTTVIFFVLFITTQLILQSLFFQSFYTNRKITTLKDNLNVFTRKYIINFRNSENTLFNIKEFERDNNAKIVILESNGLLSYITDSKEEIKDTNKVSIIEAIIHQWTSNPENFKKIQKQGKTITYIFNDRYYNLKHIVALTPVVINNHAGKVLFAVSSLQPVDEAVKVMKAFYVYTYIIAVILILILSSIYSKMISKPLVNLNNVALKMAKLDFKEKCEVNREDEIGSLAKTLNFLSFNLNSALSSLKETNIKLKKDIEKEKEIEIMRKEFVAAVSHELKTPISLIEGYAEGIKDNIFEEEDREYYIDVIIDEAENMAMLVNDMLELSKLESGTIKINMENFYINNVINTVVKRLSKINENKDNKHRVNIICSFQEDVKVIGDKTKIYQVITNFLTNAIRYTSSENNIYVSTSIKRDKVLIEVENEGEHIEENELNKIWDKFYKLDKSRNRKLGGTGLGLAIVKNILKLHKSDYGVVNTKKGVKFYFTLNKE